MIELWRGSVNAWECDELGHFNVRFYLARAAEAVASLAEAAGLNPVLAPDATATLIARDIHVRFLAEARPGAPLYIEGGFLDHDDVSATAILVMRHSASGTPAASFRIELLHAAPRSGRGFAWPQRFAAGADALKTTLPDFAAPRGLVPSGAPTGASREQADSLGLEIVGRGRFGIEEMDGFGRLRTEFLLGRVSDSVTNFASAFPEEWAMHAGTDTGEPVASALLECHIRPHHWPRTGDGFEIRSGLKSCGPRVRNIVHWVLDTATGRPWWTMEGVAAPMDLAARRLRVVPDDIQARIAAVRIDGLET